MKPRYCIISFFVFLLAGQSLFCQNDSAQQKFITVHFLYGSKPARGFKTTERKLFGGIHGGHVSIQIDTSIFSFTPKYGWHIIAHHRKIKGGFILESVSSFVADTIGDKYTSIQIPISDSQYAVLKNFEAKVLAESPYDYAFFGMRCAAGAADVLSQLGILKKRSNFGLILKDFYPKRLRKKLFRYAEKEKLKVMRKEGRKSRKWERD